MQTPDQLKDEFGLPDTLAFDEPHPGMPRARITTPGCTAELYLQGAHLALWQPTGQEPALFLSERSAFAPGKAIRGGIPIVFPWFGSPDSSPVKPPDGSPSHGFARTSPWSVRFAALAGDNLHLSLTLDQTERQSALGFEGLQLAADFSLGRSLRIRLTAANSGDKPLLFEEALHSYLSIGEIDQVNIEGLKDTEFLDKTEDFRRKTQTEAELRFSGETDRPYLNTSAPLTLTDPVLRRRVVVTKGGSKTTVVWNPAPALTAKLPDLDPDAWHRFACIEAGNVAENAITLQPREAHTMEMQLSLDSLT